MHLLSIPRHQIEATAAEYARMVTALAGFGDRAEVTRRFEVEFAAYVGCRHAIAVASGRLGLHLILQYLGIEPQSEVIVPAFNYFVVVERFLDFGLRPVFADVQREDLNLDPRRCESLISPRTRVLLATHMFGQPCDMDALGDLARRQNLVLIEDCAHGLGSRHRGRHVGTFGRAAIFSFSVMKMITTFSGGMIATDDDELAGRIREDLAVRAVRGNLTQSWKQFAKGMALDVGTRTLPFSFGAWPALRVARALRPRFQQRMMIDEPHRIRDWSAEETASLHTFQAALGRSQLRRIDSFIERRRQVMEWLDEELAGIDSIKSLRRDGLGRHNGMYYGALADRPEELSAHLFARGIDSETAEYRDCAGLEMYREFGGRCPIAREVASRILRLPNHPRMTRRDVRRIGKAIRSFYGHEPAYACHCS